MSSEFDKILEDFLNGGIDIGLADSYQYFFDAQIKQGGSDSQMPYPPAGDVENFVYEVPDQLNDLDPTN
jgi:hypothetical protein